MQIRRGLSDQQFEQPQWQTVSEDAIDFVKVLMVMNPLHRLTVKQIMKQPWLTELMDPAVAKSLSPDYFERVDAVNTGRKKLKNAANKLRMLNALSGAEKGETDSFKAVKYDKSTEAVRAARKLQRRWREQL